MNIDYKLRNEITYQNQDLSISLNHQFAFQTYVQQTIKYDLDYFHNYVNLENTDISKKLNKFRTSISSKYCNNILDIGIGSGEFIKNSKIQTFGYDINPIAIKWLKEKNIFIDPFQENINTIDGFTFWDSLEHFYEPSDILHKIPKNKYIFISLPIFNDIKKIKESKHYKPDEHLSYFTNIGLINFLEKCGFQIIENLNEETIIGRNSIDTIIAQKFI